MPDSTDAPARRPRDRAADALAVLRRRILGYPDAAPAEHGLALREIDGHLTYDKDSVRAWYRLHPVQQDFRTVRQLEATYHPYNVATAALAGRSVHRRRVPRPFSVERWQRDYEDANPDTPNPAAFHAQTERTAAWLRASPRLQPDTWIGVEICPRTALDLALAAARRGPVDPDAPSREQRRIEEDLRVVDQACTVIGRRATAAEITELVHRSVALGLPMPVDLATGEAYSGPDLFEFTAGVETHPLPGRAVFRVDSDAFRTGVPLHRYGVVLALGRIEDRVTPGPDDPWIPLADRLGYAIEWSEHVKVLAPDEVRQEVDKRLQTIIEQQEQYRKHRDAVPPPDLDMVAAHALDLRKNLAKGSPLANTWVKGSVYAAVTGRTEREALDKAQALTMLYRAAEVQLHRITRGQGAHARSFIPGEKPAAAAYTRRMELGLWTGGMPNVDAGAGDGRGQVIGHTSGSITVPWLWDLHGAMIRGESSGVSPIVAEPGAGKSTLAADVLHEASLAGVISTAVDPGGGLAVLSGLDDLRGLAKHIDLTHAGPGALSAWAAFPDPPADRYAHITDPDRRAALRKAHLLAVEQRRKALALDQILGSLSPKVAARQDTELLLTEAIRRVGGAAGGSMRRVAETLGDRDEMGRKEWALALSGYLRDLSEHPLMRPFWEAADGSIAADSVRCLILTMPDAVLPDPDENPALWPVEERLAMPLALSASVMATSRTFSLPREERKLLVLDEAWALARNSSGRALMARATRTSRYNTTRTIPITHNAGEFTANGMLNRITEGIVGHTGDPEAQREACRLLRIEPGNGFEQVLGSLSPVDPEGNRPPWRQYVMRLSSGRTQTFRSDLRHKPHLLAALARSGEQTARERVRLAESAA